MTINIILAFLILIIFFSLEQFLRFGQSAKELKRTKHDKNSTNLLGLIIVFNSFGILIAPFLNKFHLMNIDFASLSSIGLVFMFTGLLIRVTAALTLEKFYTKTLQHIEKHRLITNGIYRYIRHPGYLGVILLFVGGALTVQNYLCIILSLGLVAIYVYRIQTEETMLISVFGDKYKDYQKGTKKLIPFIY